MRFLAFENALPDERESGVRRAVFERRSSLPVSAACVVANGVREALCSLLKTPVTLRLLEPLVPDPDAWAAISADAYLYAVRGSVNDAALVLRPADALAFAAAAFGEQPAGDRPLSRLEGEVTVRALRALAGSLAAVCGPNPTAPEPIDSIGGFTTYFEMLVEQPAPLRIGVAVARDPAAAPSGRLAPENLADVLVELTVDVLHGTILASALLDLRPGVILPMNTRIGEPGLLKLGASVIGRGECGAVGEHHAIRLQSCPLQG